MKGKKLISMFLAFIMAFMTASPAFAAYFENQSFDVNNGLRAQLLLWKNVGGTQGERNFAPALVTWTHPDTNKLYYAYCVNPTLSGQGDDGVEYDMDLIKILDGGDMIDGKTGEDVANKVRGAIVYGFPNKTAAELGVKDDYAAFYATKMAMWSLIHNSYSNLNDWTPNYAIAGGRYTNADIDKVEAAMKQIANQASSYTGSSNNLTATITPTTAKPEKVGNELIQEYSISVSGANGVDYTVKLTNNTAAATIVDSAGVPVSVDKRFSIGEKFKVKASVPATLPYDIQAKFDVSVFTDSPVVVYAEPSASQLKGEKQNYVFCGMGSVGTSGTFTASDGEEPEETPPPPGKWTIYKLDAKTGKPLPYVTFDIYNNVGQLIDSGTTDASGIYVPKIKNYDVSYTVIERTTNPDYQLTEPTTQVVFVESGKQTTTYFRDFQKQIVEGHKVDATTGIGIPGVQFQITQVDGKGAWKSVTETDGEGGLAWEDVPDGTYTVHEVSTVTGYILDPTPQVVTVRNGMAPSLKFTNSKFPGLTITKIDRQTGMTVTKPATFHIEQIDGTHTADVTTLNGIINLKDLPVGTYKITETSAPEGYVLDKTCETVYLGKGESKQYIAQNLKKPVLTIEKIDKQTRKAIPGVKFEIKKTDGTIIGTVTTGADGTVTVGLPNSELGYLEPGTYTVTETFVPEPYVLPTDGSQIQNIVLNAGDTKSLMFSDLEMPTIIVEKYDEQTGAKLPGAQFAIYEQADTSRPVVEGMTDAQGKFTSGYIMPGTYVVKELLPPPGYMLSDKTQSERVIVAKAGDGVITVKVDNILLPKLIIKKLDAVTKEPIPGITFKVTQTDDTSFQPATAVTNAQGIIEIPGLKSGTYTVTEISVPSNYILDPTPQNVNMEAGDTKTLLFENTKYPTLVITKTDYSTNKPVPDTTFKVEYENTTGGTELVGTYRTDTNGRIVLPFVKVGWYVITETIPAQGMQLPSNPVTRIYLNLGTNSYTDTSGGNIGGNSAYSVTSGFDYPVVAGIVNYPLNSIVIKKADANTGEMLSGATFELIKTSGATSGQNGTTIGTFTTDASGVIVVTGLEGGTYAVRETKAPQNYIITETSLQTVNMKADGTSIIEVLFRNYPFGNILITKVDGVTGEPLAGATFRVTNNSGAAIGNSTGEFTTDSQGQFLVSNVEPGSYVVTEIKAPANYVINTTPKTVQVGTDGGTYKISFDNYPHSSILVTKIDGVTHEPLAGATFKVTDAAGKAVGSTTGEYTTNSQGEFSIPNVAPGSYIVTEIKAPDNYAINTTPKAVEVTADAKVYKVSFDNYPFGAILITKIDGLTREPLAGAKFKITDATGKVVGNTTGEYTTDSKGEILIPNIAPRSYVVTEIQAPANYAINNTPKSVEVSTDGKTQKLSFDNYPFGTLIIKKLDTNSKEPLSGAEFMIKTAKGDVVGTSNGYYTTDARGEIVVPNLSKGNYVVTETKAPTGYILEQQTKTIDIDYGNSYTLEFFNTKMSSMQIVKIDAQTKQPLKDAEFKVYKMDGQLLGSYKTDGDGLILFDKLAPGWYKILETKAPAGYLIDETPRDIEITGNQFEKVIFENQPMSSLVIKKFDATTKQPLLGARFKITKKLGDVVGEYTTDANGIIKIDNMAPGWYTATEIAAPEGYKLYDGSQDFEIMNTKTVTLEFPNQKLTSLIIKKIDDKSGAPLRGAKFKVERQNGEIVGEFTTDSDGTINIPTLTPDWYVVREIKSPDGYLLDESPKTIQVKTDVPTVVTFTNKVKSGFQIIKIDAKSGTPLPGAKFTVYKKSGDVIGEFTTDNNGVVILDNLENGWYKIAETKAPDGYVITDSPKDVELTGNQFLRIVFENKKMTSLEIKKIDAVSGAPLPGAQFSVEKQNGEKVYTSENGTIFTTDGQGIINIPTLEPDYYIVREVKAPVGYVSDESPKTVQVKTDSPTVVTFENKKMTALQIVKIDGVTGKTLPGAKFTVEKQNGEKIQTNENGTEFTTDGQGLINIPNLPPDYYIVREIKAPEGYVVNETPKTVQVKSDSPTIVTVENKPLSGLKIVKINSETKAPIEGVEFQISQMNGEKIPNGSNTYRFITDKTGQIYVPSLPDGYYVVTETKAADGYFLDAQPKTVEVKSGSTTVLEIENSPASGLLIVKTDAKTRKPLQGVVFDIRKADGQRVQSSILDANQPNTPNNSPNKTTSPNGDISGSYTTDTNGRILISTLAPGEYNVVETKALQGYELDTDVHAVTIVPGKQATLQLTNNPMSGLRIFKIDSVTKKGIYDVEFRVYDFETNKEVGGPYLTDANGVIDFSGVLSEGRYKIMETREAPGYLRDTLPRTIEFKAGKTLEIIWENSPQMGQVQVTKKSASDNEVNGLPAGTPLAGAVFELYHYKTGNVMDQFTTGNNGVGVSKPLPIGRYILKEVVSPKYYKISDQQIDFEIEFSSQIVKFEFTNEPANTGVSIKKTGPAETMSGQQIRYDFKVIQNTSTVPLTDFYWRDIVPGNVLRLDKVVTGTYNQSLKYKIMFKTNKNDYRVMADNLSTTHNNVVDASPAALGMFSDEYVTEIMFVFGNVKAGFSLVETPQIYATVKSGFPKGFQFANKADIGGKYGQEWIIGNTTWVTTIFANQPNKLPRTGY